MDATAWRAHIEAGAPSVYAAFLGAAEGREGGARVAWALNLMQSLCQELAGSDDPASLPEDASMLLRGMQTVVHGFSQQMQRKALVFVRAMLATVPALSRVLRAFPVRLRSTVDPVHRQRRLVEEDAFPKGIRGTWVVGCMRKIIDNPISSAWRTSKSARQILSMVHHFLHSTKLLDHKSYEEFECHIKGLSADGAKEICQEFCEKHCHNEKGARRYARIQNIVFHHVWSVMPQPIKATRVRRRFRTLAEVDEALSDSSAHGRAANDDHEIHYLTEAQCRALEAAARGSLRDHLLVRLLLTTGLRRQGVANIRICNVASWDEEKQHWVMDKAGETLEKGGKRRSFPLYEDVQGLLDQWLNGPGPGARPPSPSGYVFPSAVTNNGQISTDTLRLGFRSVCRRAGIPKHLSHLHAMRHTCAHRLRDAGNSARQIAAYLGHASSATTERFYLRDSVENITRGMVRPAQWVGGQEESHDSKAPKRARIAADVADPGPSKAHRHSPSLDALQRAVALREERNRQRERDDN